MKFQNLLTKYAGILVLALLIGLNACTDDCASKDCGPNSVGCEDGVCICEFGYFGEFCDQIDTTSLCEGIDCGPNSIACESGICICEFGYFGELCEQIDTASVCDTLDCGANGIVVQNGLDCFCECNDGWEGDNCEIQSSLNFLGIYTATSSCDSETFIVTVEESTIIEGGIKFINFSNLVNPTDPNLDFVVNASVDGTAITIFIVQDGITVNGTGELTENGNINLTYTLTDEDGNEQSCTDILTAS